MTMPVGRPKTTVTLACGHVREMRPETVLVLVCQRQPADRLLCFDCGVVRPVVSAHSSLEHPEIAPMGVG